MKARRPYFEEQVKKGSPGLPFLEVSPMRNAYAK